ncbi:MAG: hypothetical protein NC822_00400 [Candidatus Omnitrophica bacterium]|nr:hypothetical protein [Candidatus Omnitrophota bacterium]
MRYFILIPVIFFIFVNPAWGIFVNIDGIDKTLIKRIFVSPLEDNIVYVTSENVVFKSQDSGRSWQSIFVAKDGIINDIYVDDSLYDTIYIVTSAGVYSISDGKTEKIFTFSPSVEGKCIGAFKDRLYLGTTVDLRYTYQGAWQWRKLEGLPEKLVVYSLDFSQDRIYLASSKGVYIGKGKDFKNFERVFVLLDENQDDNQTEESPEETEDNLSCRYITVDRYDDRIVYLGLSRGLFVSYDEGKSWKKVLLPLIENVDVRGIFQTKSEKDTLYITTNRGIFLVNLKKEFVSPLFEGLSTQDTYWLDFDRKGRLFVATDRGLFLREQLTSSVYSTKIEEVIEGEPSIEEVQKVALRYNEVHPEKIRQWRNALKLRGLFPEIDISYDKTIYGTYSSGGQFAVGPRDWGVNFSWDVGDVIWNSYEDDVDSRSRLNTQLRINILDDINRVYFERLRIKLELQMGSFSEMERLNKELRLKELTAVLDGYTGGYFSKRIKEKR